MTISGIPEEIPIDAPTRRQLLSFFEAPRTVVDKLACNRHDPSRPFLYRGWLGPREDRPSSFEVMEIGPDVAHGLTAVDDTDPLKGRTPMPPEFDLPGWQSAIRQHYFGMERVADAVMRSVTRALGMREETLSEPFVGGISSLRLLRYPARAPEEILSEPHFDFGCLTLLVQDDVEGLQAHVSDGSWVDVPPVEGRIVVNFGTLLARWTAGRIRATEHRVVCRGRERFSLPFFYEPRVDAEIKPLSLPDAPIFDPFLYGDHVWRSLPRLRRLFGDRLATHPK